MDVASQAVEELKAGLRENLLAVALFGSRARGEAHRSSDWDLFVLAESLPENRLDRQFSLKAMLSLRLAGKISILAKTRKEFEADLRPVYLDIAADAVILYDPQEYLTTKLQAVRDLARDAGLRRRRWKGQWIWDWEKPPQGVWEVNWR
jgi:predicted nucleotidyltransferase